MRRTQVVQKEVAQIGTILDLTSIFETIASMRIAKIKDKVVSSQSFFDELWQLYTQLRIDPSKRLTSGVAEAKVDRHAYVVVTSEGGLSGDIDQRIVSQVAKDYDPATDDIIVIGAHGATQMAQRQIPITQYFKLPDVDEGVDVGPIINVVRHYRQTSAYFERYVSLGVQETARIDLISAIQSLTKGQTAHSKGEIISSLDYVFEPSLDRVIDFMEGVMLEIALSQVILESKLAQYASRFNAMSAAHRTAEDLEKDLQLTYHRAKRAEGDERTKEIINTVRVKGAL